MVKMVKITKWDQLKIANSGCGSDTVLSESVGNQTLELTSISGKHCLENRVTLNSALWIYTVLKTW